MRNDDNHSTQANLPVVSTQPLPRTRLVRGFRALSHPLIVAIFTAVGAIASVICAVVAVIQFLPESIKRNSFIEETQLQIASALAPVGYSVASTGLYDIKSGQNFRLRNNRGARLEGRKERHTVSVTFDNYFKAGRIVVDGRQYNTDVGAHFRLTNEPESCFVWLYGKGERLAPDKMLDEDASYWDFEFECP